MSTRAQVLVVQDGLLWKESMMLYHHCDGYPTGMAPLFIMAKEIAGGGFQAGRTGYAASCLCASDPLGFQPERSLALHGDIEWFYLLRVINVIEGSPATRWLLEVYRPKTGFYTLKEPRMRNLAMVFSGSVEEMADAAAEIEAGS